MQRPIGGQREAQSIEIECRGPEEARGRSRGGQREVQRRPEGGPEEARGRSRALKLNAEGQREAQRGQREAAHKLFSRRFNLI
jgi:hypothetical protein